MVKAFLASLMACVTTPALAQNAADPNTDLAIQLTNPVASLIQVPVQNNFEWGWGLDGEGFRYTANIQPVVPLALNADWNLISRTILPVIAQGDVTGLGTSQFGLGDTLQSLFFSPAKPSASGVVWGAGPVVLLPTASDRALGTGKLGIGPTAVVLRIDGQISYGALANHIWSIAGSSTRGDVSASFVQPFLSYTTRKATTFTIQTETSYDWLGDVWLVPVTASASQLVVLGRQPVSIGGGVRYWLASPTGGPDWGLRLNLSLLFPRAITATQLR